MADIRTLLKEYDDTEDAVFAAEIESINELETPDALIGARHSQNEARDKIINAFDELEREVARFRAERDADAAYLFDPEFAEGEAILTVNILRRWDREKMRRFALHLLGDEAEKLLANLPEVKP